MEEQSVKSGYAKRPLWQWVVLYVIIGAIVYGLIYYFVFTKKGGSYNYSTPKQSTQSTSSSTASQAPAAGALGSGSGQSSNIYIVKTDATKGQYLADFQGRTLYIFDKDTKGVSNCYNGCATTWPIYTSGATAQDTFPANIIVINRTDGTKQFAWKGMPLYYYQKDAKAGDITGDGVGGVWHIVKP